jgi:arylsulfatase A-like enzyme
MGDDIGFMQPHIYHRGLMVGETPNIDRIGQEGSIFMDYVAMQSCTSGRNAFLHGDVSAAHGLDPTGAAGQPGLSAARHPGGRGVHATRVGPKPARRAYPSRPRYLRLRLRSGCLEY